MADLKQRHGRRHGYFDPLHSPDEGLEIIAGL